LTWASSSDQPKLSRNAFIPRLGGATRHHAIGPAGHTIAIAAGFITALRASIESVVASTPAGLGARNLLLHTVSWPAISPEHAAIQVGPSWHGLRSAKQLRSSRVGVKALETLNARVARVQSAFHRGGARQSPPLGIRRLWTPTRTPTGLSARTLRQHTESRSTGPPNTRRPGMAHESARTGLSKTAEGNLVRVRLPLPAPVVHKGRATPNRLVSRLPPPPGSIGR